MIKLPDWWAETWSARPRSMSLSPRPWMIVLRGLEAEAADQLPSGF